MKRSWAAATVAVLAVLALLATTAPASAAGDAYINESVKQAPAGAALDNVPLARAFANAGG